MSAATDQFDRYYPTVIRLLPFLCCLALAIWQLQYDWTNDETYHYGWTVLPLSLYLFHLRWRDRPPPGSPSGTALVGLAWVGIALLLPLIWLVREPNLHWRTIGCVLSIGAVAAAVLTIDEFGGRRWVLHFSGSILFFLVAVPWPSILERNTTGFLMPVNAAATLEALHWLQIPAIRSGNLITLREGTLGVEEACSGIRSLQSTLIK